MSEPTPVDTNYPLRIKSPLAGDLLLASMTGEEEMGRPFVFHMELLSEKFDLHFDKVVGQKVTAILSLAEGKRFFNGYVTEFRYAGASGRFSRYQAVIRPWFWFLTRTADCRIFQEKKVPDIIKEVFRDNGMADFKDRLNGTYRKWEYCVQYRESDFDFVSRLMEQEGIYYFFEHEEGTHTLILADDIGAHSPFPNHAVVPFHAETDGMHAELADHLDFWTTTQSVMPAKYASQDFNFKTPKVDLLSKFSVPNKHASPLGDPEIFDYPGEYPEPANGKKYVEIRLQELQCQHERVQAGGSCRGIAPGCLFTFEDYPREDQNKEYLVISVAHAINNMPFISGEGSTEELYRCQTEVMDKTKPFRTARQTPWPVVQGPQTAIVVGPSGEEIHTDEFGRVKVQFHWDRYGKKDENSSCWVRVSQLWAGTKWGGIHIPRIGQEVLVSFMEGDPDHPIITGRVYNADYMPPYGLPENKTQSGIKSRSSKEGSADNFNEFRFEDKKGEELIYLQAEKDLTTLVENDEQRTTINTRTVEVGAEDNTRPTETIESLQVFGKRLIDIRGNDGLTVSEGDKGRKIDIQDGSYELVIEKVDHLLTVKKGKSATVVDTGNISTEAGKGNISTEAKLGNITVKAAAGKITMEAAMEISMTVGPSSIKIDNSGITIKGPMLNIEGTAMAELKSPMTTVKGDGTLILKGGICLIN